MKKHVLKVELQGYLADAIRAVAETMNTYGVNVPPYGDIRQNFGLAAVTATAAENEIKLKDIHTAFQAVAEARQHVEARAARVREQKEEARRIAEEEARKQAEADARREKLAALLEESVKGNGFQVNAAAVFAVHNVGTSADKTMIREQLEDAPLFAEISACDMYQKRAAIMYNLTNGADVIEAYAVDVCDYVERFNRELQTAINEMYYKMTYSDFETFARFWRNDSIIRQGLLENKIAAAACESFGIRSPKFSKHLIKTFGEKATIVKLFNDRPKAAEMEKETAQNVDGLKIHVSNLAANVMKMTAGNEFSSCQDYTYDDESDLDYLQKLPTSVHDETMSIAYLTDESETYESPTMKARVLLSPLEYAGQLFFIAWNLYGDSGNDDILKASLKNLYGKRVLFADDMYNTNRMVSWEHEYNYYLQVNFTYDSERECYMCEGSGNVDVTVRYHDYTFETECPNCNGSGQDEESGGSYGSKPYVNNGAFIRYSGNSKETRADEDMIISIIFEEVEARTAEMYGNTTIFDQTETA